MPIDFYDDPASTNDFIRKETLPFFDVRAYGAVPGPNANQATNLQAFKDAINAAATAADPSTNPIVDAARGGMVYVPFGIWYLSDTLALNHRVVLQGVHGWGRALAGASYPGSILQFPANKVGIKVLYGATTTVPRADFAVIRDLALRGTAASPTDVNAHGIQMDARASVENSSVVGFDGDGINIVAYQDLPNPPSKKNNADGWQIKNCRVEECKQNGLYVEGTTANAGTAIALDVNRCTLWGISDRSKTGNTYIGCQCAENGESLAASPPVTVTHGNYHSEENDASSDFNRSVFLRCYSEGPRINTFARATYILAGFASSGQAGTQPQGGQHLVYNAGTGNLLHLRKVKAAPGAATDPGPDAFIVTEKGVAKLGGPLQFRFDQLNGGTYTLDERYGIFAVNANANTTVSLPTIADDMLGRSYTVKKIAGTGTLTLNGASGQTIDGQTSIPLNTLYQYVTVAAAKQGSTFFWMIIASG